MINERQLTQPDLTAEASKATRVARSGGNEGNNALKVGGIAGFMLSAEVGLLLTGAGSVDAHDLVEDAGMDTLPTVTTTAESTEALAHTNRTVDEGADAPTATQRPLTGMDRSRSRVAVHQADFIGEDAVGVEESAQVAQIDPTPTPLPETSPTPSPTPDSTPVPSGTVEPVLVAQVPSPTPEPGETLVAMVPEMSLAASLQGYPPFVDIQPAYSAQVRVELNPNTLRPMVGIDGRDIISGFYPGRPSNLGATFMGSQTIVESANNINGIQAEYGYIVGFVSRLAPPDGYNQGYVVHITYAGREVDTNGRIIQEDPEHKHYATVAYGPNGQGNRMYAISENGQVIQTSPNSEGGTYRVGTDANTNVVLTPGELTFPTAEGIEQLRVGDPIIMTVVMNSDQMGRALENNGVTNDEVIARQLDSDPNNDVGWYDQTIPMLPQQFIYTMRD